MSKPIIAVVGATGNQGGSIVRELLSVPVQEQKYHVRALTRNPDSSIGQELKALGAEVVKTDINDYQQTLNAFTGAWVAFGVTNFWDPDIFLRDQTKEIKQGKTIADAAKAANVEYFFWSTLPSVTKVSKGTITGVPHFDQKTIVEDYIREINLKAIFISVGFFLSNLWTYYPPRKVEDGTLVYSLPISPSNPTPVVYPPIDTGRLFKALLENPQKYVGQVINLSSESVPIAELISRISKVTGIPMKFQQITPDEYYQKALAKGLPKSVVDESRETHKWVDQFGYYGTKNPDLSLANQLARLVSVEEVTQAESDGGKAYKNLWETLPVTKE